MRTKALDQKTKRIQTLINWAFALAVILFFKTLLMILVEYQYYFPASFESNFLAGRKQIFKGLYRVAFYVHILTGPVALVISAFLMFSGKRNRYHRWHRTLGKLLVAVTLGLMLPSGMVMATEAFTGPVAGVSFFTLTAVTSMSIVMAAWHAKNRRFTIHRVWATRSFLLLSSPLLLRLMTGATIVMQIETEWTYRIAVWTSWTLPLGVYELRRRIIPAKTNSHSDLALTENHSPLADQERRPCGELIQVTRETAVTSSFISESS
ncbi:MAG: DUF2306 domain-containing protein [Planctomycetota bacterium]